MEPEGIVDFQSANSINDIHDQLLLATVKELEIRRAFAVFQLMTILEEPRHSLILIKHDLSLHRTPYQQWYFRY